MCSCVLVRFIYWIITTNTYVHISAQRIHVFASPLHRSYVQLKFYSLYTRQPSNNNNKNHYVKQPHNRQQQNATIIMLYTQIRARVRWHHRHHVFAYCNDPSKTSIFSGQRTEKDHLANAKATTLHVDVCIRNVLFSSVNHHISFFIFRAADYTILSYNYDLRREFQAKAATLHT